MLFVITLSNKLFRLIRHVIFLHNVVTISRANIWHPRQVCRNYIKIIIIISYTNMVHIQYSLWFSNAIVHCNCRISLHLWLQKNRWNEHARCRFSKLYTPFFSLFQYNQSPNRWILIEFEFKCVCSWFFCAVDFFFSKKSNSIKVKANSRIYFFQKNSTKFMKLKAMYSSAIWFKVQNRFRSTLVETSKKFYSTFFLSSPFQSIFQCIGVKICFYLIFLLLFIVNKIIDDCLSIILVVPFLLTLLFHF